MSVEVCEGCGEYNAPPSQEKLDKIRDYATGLRTWSKTNRESEIATDLLYLIGENK